MKHQAINLLIEDIERILDSLFMSGLGSAPKDVEEDCRCIAEECQKYGLDYAGKLLVNIAEILGKRRHSVEFDLSDGVHEVCVLSCYIDIVKSNV